MKKQIKPLYSNLLVLPYEKNPYLDYETKEGFIINDEKFDNPDTGEVDMLFQEVVCGKVIEVGPWCKYTKVGDDIFFNIRTTKPVPFNRDGFILCNEQSVMAVMADDLDTRF